MRRFHLYDITFWYLFMYTVLAVSMISCWSAGMIPEKVTWIQFSARISTVYSKPLPINDLIFQFLIKHLHICSYKFLIEYQIRKYVQLCCVSSTTFSQYFQSFMLIWPFQEKSHFRLYLQSSKQWI